MIYETKISVEIAGIRRSVRIAFEYHVESISGEMQVIHDSARVLSDEGPLPGRWVYEAIGPRQLKQLHGDLIEYWNTQQAA